MLSREQRRWAHDQIEKACEILGNAASYLECYADAELDNDAWDTAADIRRAEGFARNGNVLKTW